MKTLRVLFSGIFCILLSYSLSSCGGGDDDDVTPPDSGQTGGSTGTGGDSGTPSAPSTNSSKKLVRVDKEQYSDNEIFKFQYDSQGNLSFVSVDDGYALSEYTYQYNSDKILVSGFEQWQSPHEYIKNIKKTYYLYNGKVVSITAEEEYDGDITYGYYNFEYNNTENRLARVYTKTDYSSDLTYVLEDEFSWIGDKLVGVGSSYDDGANIYYDYFNYNAEPLVCKGYFPLLECLDIESIEGCYLLWAKPEFASMKVNTLPYSSDDEVYTYELDDDGYIKKMCVQEDGEVPTFYNFTWK